MAMTQETYEIKIEKIFEGPMDLLLHLIRKNEVDIYDIPIAMITEQFLEYLQWLDAMNIDYAGDFLAMASSLTHIKSRMLLPPREGEEDGEDPRMEIARPLLEYIQLKQVAEKLTARSLLDEDVFTRPDLRQEIGSEPDAPVIRIGLFELIDAFQTLLNSRSSAHRIDLNEDRISVTDRISQLVDLLEAKGSMTFDELFPPAAQRDEIIVTFLAILEMAKLSLIQMVQHAGSGIIRILYL